MKKLNVLFVTHHWKENSHHSIYSGYQRIVDFFPKDKIDATVLTWGDENKVYEKDGIKVIIKKVPKFARFYFKRNILSNEASKLSGNYDLVHALYDDVAPVKSKVKLISTFHTFKNLDKDSKYLKFRFFRQKKVLNKSDKIIVLSKNLKEILSKYTNSSKINVVHYGIDTNYFKRKKKLSDEYESLKKNYKKIILCIGNYGTQKEKVLSIAKSHKDFLFIILNNKWEIETKDNILFYNRVGEEKLLELYSLADILYRPLKFSAGNTSIVEGLAMGLKIFTNPTEGIKDYLDKTNSVIIENEKDFDEAIKNELSIKDVRPINANNLDWKIIAYKTYELYEEILNENRINN
ncbi:hypothetical protein COU57_05305 [Candidatus Pacearchaeota archaeon CG10_big_fil_rev_8_21_14_0_10_32_14]|nr:MAG: hypothetical protein COU57_05305 [Candidatus Pacearchaeota archaeon CG10_big_fil_rev_8_21_14_0_10_32_14]